MADIVLTELKIHEFDSVEQMSQYESEIGENDMVYTPDTSIRLPILTPMWFDHQVNDESWLNADIFSWQSGDVYVAVYEHLANDINGKTLQSEVIGDITIVYYLADDGHKICLPDQESNLSALYESTGVAWYYILDADNQQFKLPRTNWGFTGLRDGVGNYVEAGLPNITGSFRGKNAFNDAPTLYTGAFGVVSASNVSGASGAGSSPYYFDFDASRSSSIYGKSSTVQPPATQMHLYFWVGAFDQTATEQTAGLNTELFNGKADRNLLNTTDNVDIVIESQLPTADNGYTWYRKYKSGWVEQGGTHNRASGAKVTLLIPMASTPYWITLTCYSGTQRYTWCGSLTTTSFQFSSADDSSANNDGVYCWTVRGMAE